MKKVIVTGGLGFIGSNLIKLLLKKNYYVVNVDKVSYSGLASELVVPWHINNLVFVTAVNGLVGGVNVCV